MRRRTLLSFLLALYCLGLVVAAIPYPLSAIAIAHRALAEFTIEPGLSLFFLPYHEDWKPRRECIEVRLVDQESKTLGRFKLTSGCEPVTFRWFENIFDTAVFRMFEDARDERTHQGFLLRTDAFRDMRGGNNREGSLYAALGDYYCHSSSYARPETARVQIGWWLEQTEYATGTSRKVLNNLVDFKCANHEITEQYWFPYIPQEKADAFTR